DGRPRQRNVCPALRTSMTDTGPRHGDLAFLLDGAVAVGSKLDDCHNRIAGHFSVGEEGFASVQHPFLGWYSHAKPWPWCPHSHYQKIPHSCWVGQTLLSGRTRESRQASNFLRFL